MATYSDTASTALVAAALAAMLSGCFKQEGPAERAGKVMDEAVEKAGQKVEQAGRDLQNAAKDAAK